MVDLLLDGDASAAFSSHRPPGHHALPSQAMGFCLFNHIAVAARYALDGRRLEGVMIIDWDVHHGNSTNHIFHPSRQVLFVSIHQSPLFPFTGQASDVGEGEGAGFTVNLPVPAGAGDQVWVSLIEHVVVPVACAFEPQLVLISAGDDAHRYDPLADCAVTEEGFAAMTRAIARVCASLSAPVGAVLEGGYALGALGRSVAATLQALSTEPTPDAASSPASALTPIAHQARTRLAEFWPQLPAGPRSAGSRTSRTGLDRNAQAGVVLPRITPRPRPPRRRTTRHHRPLPRVHFISARGDLQSATSGFKAPIPTRVVRAVA